MCEFSTTSFSEKSEVTKAQVNAAKEKPMSKSWIRAAGSATAIQDDQRRSAPIRGTVAWISATASARINAKCPSSTIIPVLLP